MKYSSYSASIIRWNHEYPSHWACEKAKRFFTNPKTLNKKLTESNIMSLTLRGVIRNNGTKPIGLSPADYSTYQVFEPSELVFKLIDLENIATSRVGLVYEKGIMSSAYIRLKPKVEMNVKYFYYQYFDWYKRRIFNGLGDGVRQTLSGSNLLNLEILVPPIDEQNKIVNYLNWQVSSSNKLINTLKEQISLLKEYRQTVIDEAVTKGLDSITSRKDSGVDWIGEIPTTWKLVPMCSIAKIISETNRSDRELLSVYLNDGVIPFSQKEQKRTNPTSKDLTKYQHVRCGDLVLNNQQSWRGSVGVSKIEGIVSPAYIVLELNKCMNSDFANLFFRSRIMVYQYGLASKGVGSIQRNLYWSHLKRAHVILPPLSVQIDIVQYINNICERIDALIENIEKEISLLGEYRTRLIYDVTTGNIDIRNIEVPEFDGEIIEITDINEDEISETEELEVEYYD